MGLSPWTWTLARHKRLRLPVAAAVVVALFAMLATFAIRDLAYSSGLLVLTIGLSLFSGSLVFLLLSREYKLPAPRWSTELWIWSEARGGAYRSERTWVPATYPTSTLLAQPPPWTLVVGLLSAIGALLVVAIGTVRWAESYQTLIVVDAAFDDGPLSVKVDGQPLGEVRSTDKEDDDIAWHQFTIRTGRDRAIDIASASGRQWHYTVDPSERPLLAPGARESHLQFVGSSVTYVRSGTSRPADGFERLSECGDDRLQLRHDYTSKFHPAPDSVMMERGQDKHVEWQLRAFDCDPTHRRPEYTTTFREAREDLKPIPQ